MNTGIIASRYAEALLKLVDETGGGEAVIVQVQHLCKVLDNIPDLRRALVDVAAVSADRKVSLLEASLPEGEKLCPELEKFINLLVKNGRIGDIRLIFNSFVTAWYKSRNIVRGKLSVPVYSDSTPALEQKLREIIESRTGSKLLMATEVNPDLIGGFVFEVEDMLLDASVSHQLELIKRQFIEKNRRIV